MTYKNANYKRVYYEAHRVELLERARLYRLAHADRIQETNHLYYETHKTAWLEAGRQYYKLHPEKTQIRVAIRRARKAGAFVESVDRQVVFERDGGICGICQESVDSTNWHLDHIQPLSKGGLHSYENTQVAHPVCNLRKGTDCG